MDADASVAVKKAKLNGNIQVGGPARTWLWWCASACRPVDGDLQHLITQRCPDPAGGRCPENHPTSQTRPGGARSRTLASPARSRDVRAWSSGRSDRRAEGPGARADQSLFSWEALSDPARHRRRCLSGAPRTSFGPMCGSEWPLSRAR